MSTAGRSLRPRATIKRKRNADFVDSSTISRAVLNGRVTKKSQTKAKVRGVANRSTSAPPIGFKLKSKGSKIYQDVKNPSDMDWSDSTKKGIRLVFPELDPGKGSFQGLLLTPPCITSSTDQQLHQHLEAVRDSMITHQQPHQITEATGEAATAYAMRQRFPGAVMQWGMHVHSGAGIDQIWSEFVWTSGRTIYYIVEAKGVGATLTYKNFGPPDEIKQQMSIGWVLDNLVRMARQHGSEYNIARSILKSMGLVEVLNDNDGPFYEAFGGVSKSYYACSYDPAKRGNTALIGVVVTAAWNSGDLSYTVTTMDFGSQLSHSPAVIPLT